MVIYYIYSLTVKNKIVYVGVSVNPTTRLVQHIKADYGKLGKVLNSNKDISHISINILEVVKCYKNRVSKDLSQAEFYWVNKFLIAGHPLTNKVLKTSSSLKRK